MAQVQAIEREGLRWFAVRCPPGKEGIAAKILKAQSLIADVPTEPRLRLRRNTKKRIRTREDVRFPVAPGYVFVGWPGREEIPWRKVFRIHLFTSVIGDRITKRPLQLDSREVERLLHFEWKTSPMYYKYMRTGKEFDVGDTVTVLAGKYKDRALIVHDIQDGEARFLMQLFDKKLRVVDISVDDCVRAA